MATLTRTKIQPRMHPLITAVERLAAWERARGMWQRRQPDAIHELKNMRKGWERKVADGNIRG